MIDGKSFLDQPVKNVFIIYGNIRKTPTGQGDYYTTGCLLDYNYFKKDYNMVAIDLSKQQALCLSKCNTANKLYCKSRLRRTNRRSTRKRFRFFTRNCESVAIFFYFHIILV